MGSLCQGPYLEVEKVEDWGYRGEGAANVVVSYRGSSLHIEGKVLRIPKTNLQKERGTLDEAQVASPDTSNIRHFNLNAKKAGADEVFHADISTLKGSSCFSLADSPSGKASPWNGRGELSAKSACSEQALEEKAGSLLSPLEQEIWANYPSLVSADSAAKVAHEYYRLVMGPLLGEDLVDPGVPVPLSTAYLTQLKAAVESRRPARWQKEGPLQLLSSWALLINDHTIFSRKQFAKPEYNLNGAFFRGFPVCVEIKPKAGFLPTSGCIRSKNGVKCEKSRYELMQHWKAQRGKVKAISSYNPLDLFSSDPSQVRRAIDSLFENPQNNLRVFISGEALTWKHNESPTEESSLGRVEEALEGFCEPVDGSRLAVLKELLVQRLAGSTILDRLRSTQMLDVYDIEGVTHLYEFLCGHPPDEAVLKDLPTNTRELLDLSREFQLNILRDFLIGTTAKDCGLMLTFLPINGEEDVGFSTLESFKSIRTSQGQTFLCKAAYVDLDLKRVRKLPSYWDQDQEIVAAYKQAEP